MIFFTEKSIFLRFQCGGKRKNMIIMQKGVMLIVSRAYINLKFITGSTLALWAADSVKKLRNVW